MNKYPKKIPKMLAWQFLGVLGRKSWCGETFFCKSIQTYKPNKIVNKNPKIVLKCGRAVLGGFSLFFCKTIEIYNTNKMWKKYQHVFQKIGRRSFLRFFTLRVYSTGITIIKIFFKSERHSFWRFEGVTLRVEKKIEKSIEHLQDEQLCADCGR